MLRFLFLDICYYNFKIFAIVLNNIFRLKSYFYLYYFKITYLY